MNYIFYILAPIAIVLTLLMCWQESKSRKIHVVVAVILCLLITPFFAYFLISSQPLRNPRGCNWCGNKKNEAEYCGLCGKNENGELRN
jgi:4-amino-4-deoxy-L-arabinose transferase-like glycosyltransferase